MKAIRVLEYGRPPVLTEIPTPNIADDEVLVKVRSTAVNHLDLVKASGAAKEVFPIDLPWTPGHEFSGVVERAGKNVTGFAVGDPVFGNSTSGAYAEYVTVKPAVIARKPSNLSFEEAASVPVAAQTAWQALFTHGHLTKGQTVLIHGGAGAVGAYAVQLAAHVDATVIVTASGGDETFLRSIGAKRVIDYRKAKFENELSSKVDVVFDLVGGDTQTRSFAVLKEGGSLIAANQPIPPAELAKHHVSGRMMNMTPSAKVLGQISRLLEENTIRTDVAKVYALEEVTQAWADMAGTRPGRAPGQERPIAPRTHGKLVLKVA
jgi:NADPH:quinone reductase-like Zn-dependent oxidoreductase